MIASLGDLLVPVIIGTKYPDYNHCIQTISTLGTKNSPVQIYQRTSLIVVGALFLLFSIGQYFLFGQKVWAHSWYSVGIIIFGIGCILAGIFPEDIQGTTETISGKIHGIASGIGFILLIMCPLWAVWINEFSDYKIINLILFVLGLLTFVLFILSENRTSGFLKYTGLFQRVNLIILYGALIINFQKLVNQ
ncbi:MAG TPA: DUF998 domain-containing protein [Salinivirgaceae bacterium]|nr:DUF998 domain-containing protein [Salinivirgaceae bacterium]HQA76614.1 DUF998 domain-containing protein [Salinivirgaceae bacterium]